MSYIEHPIPSPHGGDASAMSAAISIDLLRANQLWLMDYSADSVASEAANDYTTGNTTTSLAYDDASLLWRFPFVFLATRQGGFVRQLRVDVWAAITAGVNTGTLELCVGPAYMVPASPVDGAWVSKESAAGAVTVAAAYHSIIIDVGAPQVVGVVTGAEPGAAQDEAALYYVTCVVIRGKMVAAGTMTASRLTVTEV